MDHAAEYMRDDGYDLGLLFTMIPARFYRRLGWSCVPLMGFHAELPLPPQAGRSALEVLPFDESRDLEETVALYQHYNAGRSGSLLRPRPYWDYAPSRVRGVLPTAVVRGPVRDSAGTSTGRATTTVPRCMKLLMRAARPSMPSCSICSTSARRLG